MWINLTAKPMTPMIKKPTPTAWLILMNSRLSAVHGHDGISVRYIAWGKSWGRETHVLCSGS